MRNLTLSDALDVAIRIERTGEAFYRTAAKIRPEHASWIDALAEEEAAHEAFYRDLSDREAAGAETAESKDAALAYLSAVVDAIEFRLRHGPEEELTGRESIDEIIDLALVREQDAILFFVGLARAFADPEIVASLERVIEQEMAHAARLRRRQSKIMGQIVAESQREIYDLIIVGAGPGGIGVGAEAIARGVDPRRLLVLEKASRNAWIIRKLYPDQKLVTANYKGQSGDCKGVMQMRNMNKQDALSMLSETIGDFGIPVLYELAVETITKVGSLFEIKTRSEVFRAKACVVGIGVFGKPNKPDYRIPAAVRKQTQYDVTSSTIAGCSVLVVGGGDSASEYVQHLLAAGNRLAISSREADFSYMNEENRRILRELGEEGRVEVLGGTNVESIEEADGRIRVHFEGGEPEPHVFDRIVYALGGTTPLNFLRMTGVEFDDTEAVLTESHETNIDGLYLVGDLAAEKKHGAIATAFNNAYETVDDLLARGRLRLERAPRIT